MGVVADDRHKMRMRPMVLIVFVCEWCQNRFGLVIAVCNRNEQNNMGSWMDECVFGAMKCFCR